MYLVLVSIKFSIVNVMKIMDCINLIKIKIVAKFSSNNANILFFNRLYSSVYGPHSSQWRWVTVSVMGYIFILDYT